MMVAEILALTAGAEQVETAGDGDAVAYLTAVALWLAGVVAIVIHKLRAA